MKFKSGLEITDQQVANCRQLSYWHLSGAIYTCPIGFDMANWECGTAACFAGHSQWAGLPKLNVLESWGNYCERVLLPPPICRPDYKICPEGAWCFDSRWKDTDNSPEGAAKRMLWLLEFDLPDDWLAQMDGTAPLCYADWEPEIPPEYIQWDKGLARTIRVLVGPDLDGTERDIMGRRYLLTAVEEVA